MNTVGVKRFRENLKTFIEEITVSQKPLRVTRHGGEAFVIMSEEDWRRERESLYVLQNSDLMKQIAASLLTYRQGRGVPASAAQMNEIPGV